MITKNITYTDYNGETRTESLFFNLNQTELMEMAYSDGENISNTLTKAMADKDLGTIVRFLKKFIAIAYGEKSEDGRFFVKTEEKRNNFVCSAAFDALLTELVNSNDSNTVEAFIAGVVPSALAAEMLPAKTEKAK